MAGRSVVRDDATAAVPSSQWRPALLLDAEYPDELSRGHTIGNLHAKKKLLDESSARYSHDTSHHNTDSRSQKPPSARLDAPHQPGFVRRVLRVRVTGRAQGNSSQGNSHHSPPPPFSRRVASVPAARALSRSPMALWRRFRRPPPRLPRRHLHRPFRCGNERPPSTHSPFPTATSYSQILRARARALS
jgi:hypothetical protein